MKIRQVEVNLSPRQGEDMHVEETFLLVGETLQHSGECVRCLFEKSGSPNRENGPGHSTRIVLLMLCLRCHELCLSQTMLPDSDHTQQHCYFADMAYETKCV